MKDPKTYLGTESEITRWQAFITGVLIGMLAAFILALIVLGPA